MYVTGHLYDRPRDSGDGVSGEDLRSFGIEPGAEDADEWRALIALCKTLSETPLDQLEAALAPVLWLAYARILMPRQKPRKTPARPAPVATQPPLADVGDVGTSVTA